MSERNIQKKVDAGGSPDAGFEVLPTNEAVETLQAVETAPESARARLVNDLMGAATEVAIQGDGSEAAGADARQQWRDLLAA